MRPVERGSSSANRRAERWDGRSQSIPPAGRFPLQRFSGKAQQQGAVLQGCAGCSGLRPCRAALPSRHRGISGQARGREARRTHLIEMSRACVDPMQLREQHRASCPEGGWLSRVVLSSKGPRKASSESSDLNCGPFDSKKWLGLVTMSECPYPRDKSAEILSNCSSFHQVPHTVHTADPALALVSLECPQYHPKL